MKKILALLGVLSFSVVGTSAVVACGTSDADANFNINTDALAALKKVIATQIQNGDIKDSVNKELTYNQFFNIDGSNSTNFLQTYLYDKVTSELKNLTVDKDNKKESKYSDEAIKSQMNEVLKWSQKAVHLVYIDVDQTEKATEQKIRETINSAGNGDKSLNDIFLASVKKYYPEATDEDLGNGEWWKAHSKASLAVSFDNKVSNIDLGAKSEQFWSFTFITK